MTFRYLNLRGNDLLIILVKFLESQNTTTFVFLEEFLNSVIEENFEELMEKIESQKLEFPEFSGISFLYHQLKDKYTEAKIKGIEFTIE